MASCLMWEEGLDAFLCCQGGEAHFLLGIRCISSLLISLVSIEGHLTPGLLEMCAITTEVCDSGPFLGSSFSASASLPAPYQTCRPPQVPEAMQRQWKTKSRTSGSSAMPSPLASVLLCALDVALSHRSGYSQKWAGSPGPSLRRPAAAWMSLGSAHLTASTVLQDFYLDLEGGHLCLPASSSLTLSPLLSFCHRGFSFMSSSSLKAFSLGS